MQNGEELVVKPCAEKKGIAYCALKRIAVLAALNLTFTFSCTAANGTWTNFSGGSWTNASNWANATLADGTNAVANFSTLNLTAATAVTLDGARTVGHLTFADSTTGSHDWTLSSGSGGPLTLALSSGSPTLAVTNRTATISAVIAGVSGLTKSGAGTLTLTGLNTYSGKTIVAGGNLTFNTIGNVGAPGSALGAPLTVTEGTLDLNAFLTYTGAAAATSDRAIFLTGGNGILYNTGSNLLTLTGGITGDNRNFRFRGTGEIIETGLIATGNGTVSRTDNGTVTLTNPGNSFSGAVTVYAGTISVDSLSDSGMPSALGQGTSISFGQTGYVGFGKLRFTGAGGGACNRTLTVNSPSGTASGGIIENTVAEQTLLFSGPVGVGGAGPTPSCNSPARATAF
jgi:autotransporter-associated beta strand protein